MNHREKKKNSRCHRWGRLTTWKSEKPLGMLAISRFSLICIFLCLCIKLWKSPENCG